MEILETPLPGVLLLRPRLFPDQRGYFFESYRQEYGLQGIPSMVQVNVSRSSRAVLRGLHYQRINAQAKLISVIRGAVYDVAVDLRVGSATYGKWFAQELNDENHLQMFVPVGFAHGFCVLSPEVDFLYQVSDYYNPSGEVGIRWNDPDLSIDWPIANPLLSSKDEKNQTFASLSPDLLPSLVG